MNDDDRHDLERAEDLSIGEKNRIENKEDGRRTFWRIIISLAVMVAIVGAILLIRQDRSTNSQDKAIRKNYNAIQKLVPKLTLTNQKIQEDTWIRCRAALVARKISINNYKAEQKLFHYAHTITANSLTAAQLAVKDPHTPPAALAAAKQRVHDDQVLLNVVPNIIIPQPIKPCGPEPYPSLNKKKVPAAN